MSRCILVGVDAPLSPSTHSALEMACQVLEQDTSACHLILLHVIPVPIDPTPRRGRPLGSWSYLPPTSSQLCQAHHVLQQARTLVGQRGIPLASIELLVRAGTPADELARIARERNVDLLVLGSSPPSRCSLLRRLLLGSNTRRVLRVAPCRVLLACPTVAIHAGDLIAWYEQALQLCLLQQTETLLVLTPAEGARRFALASPDHRAPRDRGCSPCPRATGRQGPDAVSDGGGASCGAGMINSPSWNTILTPTAWGGTHTKEANRRFREEERQRVSWLCLSLWSVS